MAELKRERDEAREWVRKLTAAERVLTCVYCGHAYPPGSPTHGSDTLTEHIKVCEKHPLREALDALARIALGEGPYSKDRLTHAENTIEAMKNEARAVLNKYRSDDVDGERHVANIAAGPHAEENAALVIAAPELLAALRELIEGRGLILHDPTCNSGGNSWRPEECDCALSRARAAIAKATGGES